MALDTYSKLLIIVDFAALLLLRQYLDNQLMIVPFALLMVMLWVWLYRVFAPMGFARSALASVITAVSLYVPNPYVRIVSAAIVIPAIASALHSLGSQPGKPV